MTRLIFFFSLLFMTRLAFSAEGPIVQNRQGTISGEDSRIQAGLTLQVPEGNALQIPPEVLNRLSSGQLSDLLKGQRQGPETVASLILREEILIPVIFFSSAPLIVLIIAYFAYRNRRDLQETIRLAIQSGQPLPEGVMNALDKRRTPNTQADLRKAVLLLCLGIGGAIILFVSNRGEPAVALLGLVPCVLGLGYLFLWWHADKASGRLEHERA